MVTTSENALISEILAGTTGVASFPAAAAPANNVSLAEVIRAIYDRQLGDGTNAATNSRLGKKVTRAAADIFDGTAAKSLFTVSGGKVLLTALTCEVTTAAVDATASIIVFLTNPTVGTDANMSLDSTSIASDEVGTIYSCPMDAAVTVQGGSGGGAYIPDKGWVVAEGAISITTSADAGTGGALGYCECWYIPLDDGATIVAA